MGLNSHNTRPNLSKFALSAWNRACILLQLFCYSPKVISDHHTMKYTSSYMSSFFISWIIIYSCYYFCRDSIVKKIKLLFLEKSINHNESFFFPFGWFMCNCSVNATASYRAIYGYCHITIFYIHIPFYLQSSNPSKIDFAFIIPESINWSTCHILMLT